MLVSNTNHGPNLIKYYVLSTISFLVATGFHSSVYRRFGMMQEGLQEAARIKFSMEYEDLRALNNYLESVQLHRQGIHDTLMAYEYATEAELLRGYVFQEANDVQRLRSEANEKEEEANFDKRESAMYGMDSFRNNRASVGSRITGMDLARQAEEENERSAEMMNKTTKQEKEGKKRLHEAQADLKAAEFAQNQTNIDKGICKWASAVCKAIKGTSGQSQSMPVTASDEVIRANQAVQDALSEIHNAEVERAQAIELHRNASIHANLSTTILHDAQVFRNESKYDREEAKKYRIIGTEEESDAEKDEEQAQLVETDIALKKKEIQNDLNDSNAMFQRVVVDRYKEQAALERMDRDMSFVRKKRMEWEEKKKEATQHVARAGWEALVASIAGSCLLVLVVTRIFATFRYRRPIRWVLREAPHFLRDLLYLGCHIWIVILAMGYIGELLMAFHQLDMIGRAGITIVFALNVAILQVTLLHIIPSMLYLYRGSRINRGAIRLLMEQIVIKKGVIIAIVSAIEMLLCWCWMGTLAFERIHVLNIRVVWLAVFCISTCYGYYVQMHDYATIDDMSTRGANTFVTSCESEITGNNENERHSLLAESYQENSNGSVSGYTEDSFWGSQNDESTNQGSNRSAVSSASIRSVPIGSTDSNGYSGGDYGSLTDIFRAHLSTSPANFSWEFELEKVRLLFEFLVASLAIWIVWRDLSLIRKLSPLATDLVWGRAPVWILNICMFVIFASSVISFANMKARV